MKNVSVFIHFLLVLHPACPLNRIYYLKLGSLKANIFIAFGIIEVILHTIKLKHDSSCCWRRYEL